METPKIQTKTEKQEMLQNLLMEIEAYRKQIEELSNQAQMVESRLIEVNLTIESIDSLKTKKIDSEILVPLGSSSFIRAELKDTENIIVGIGAGLSVEETIPKAKEILKSEAEKVSGIMENLQNNIIDANKRLIELDSAFKKLAAEAQM